MTFPAGLHTRRVFFDTGPYYSLSDADDLDHHAVTQIRDLFIAERGHLFTTNFILAETHALLLRRLGRSIAARVLAAIDGSATTIVRVSTGDERRAREIIAQYDDRNFSLTDATSFAVMERLHITTAFTLDHNFLQFGFVVLPEIH